LRFNSDSGANYSYVTLEGTGTTAYSDSFNGVTGNFIGSYVNAWATTNSSCISQIMDYATTDKHKTTLSRGDSGNGTVAVVTRWANTAAITSIAITNTSGGTLSSGTIFALYGVSA